MEPITKMFKKGVKWEWGPQQEEAWQRWLKLVPEILHKFDPTLQLHIETNASNSGWAAVYYQVDHLGEEKILEFRGGLFNEAERKSTASEREFLAMTNAVEDRRYWTLHGLKVMFHVDHRALLAYTNKQLITPKIWRRMDHVLRELELEIQYRPGKEMLADEFTRLTEDQSDGRYLGILLERKHFSDRAWEDIVKAGVGNSQDIYPSEKTGDDQEVLPE